VGDAAIETAVAETTVPAAEGVAEGGTITSDTSYATERR
jgi:hypothetical protein